jgi:hypothetical protein
MFVDCSGSLMPRLPHDIQAVPAAASDRFAISRRKQLEFAVA